MGVILLEVVFIGCVPFKGKYYCMGIILPSVELCNLFSFSGKYYCMGVILPDVVFIVLNFRVSIIAWA